MEPKELDIIEALHRARLAMIGHSSIANTPIQISPRYLQTLMDAAEALIERYHRYDHE